MPLNARGIAYLFLIVVGALGAAFLIIRSVSILDANMQYNVAISLIVLFIGIFFCKDNVLIGLKNRFLWSVIWAGGTFFVLYLIDSIL